MHIVFPYSFQCAIFADFVNNSRLFILHTHTQALWLRVKYWRKSY